MCARVPRGRGDWRACEKNFECPAMDGAPCLVAVRRLKRSATFWAEKLHDISFGSLAQRGEFGKHANDPKQKHYGSNDESSRNLSGAGQPRVHRDYLFGLERLADRYRFQDDPKTNNSNQGVLQGFISFLARNGSFLRNLRNAAAQSHGLA
jgi:hypothetical protein